MLKPGDRVRMTDEEWGMYAQYARTEFNSDLRTGTVVRITHDNDVVVNWDFGASNFYHCPNAVELLPLQQFAVQIGGTGDVDEAIELATKAAQLLGQPAKVIHV